MEFLLNQDHAISLLRDVVVFLAFAVLFVPTCQMVLVSPALEFLLVGMVIGTFAVGAEAIWLRDNDHKGL